LDRVLLIRSTVDKSDVNRATGVRSQQISRAASPTQRFLAPHSSAPPRLPVKWMPTGTADTVGTAADDLGATFSNRSWKQTKRQQQKYQERGFARKKDNPFSIYKHDPNDAESYLDHLTRHNKDDKGVGIIPPDIYSSLARANESQRQAHFFAQRSSGLGQRQDHHGRVRQEPAGSLRENFLALKAAEHERMGLLQSSQAEQPALHSLSSAYNQSSPPPPVHHVPFPQSDYQTDNFASFNGDDGFAHHLGLSSNPNFEYGNEAQFESDGQLHVGAQHFTLSHMQYGGQASIFPLQHEAATRLAPGVDYQSASFTEGLPYDNQWQHAHVNGAGFGVNFYP
jgi:hypothetical protein